MLVINLAMGLNVVCPITILGPVAVWVANVLAVVRAVRFLDEIPLCVCRAAFAAKRGLAAILLAIVGVKMVNQNVVLKCPMDYNAPPILNVPVCLIAIKGA